ncbi:hypothetical protein EVAR_40063_1 [Eumeta japonica]|uniref:Uncharacterized protein n=1 Tax=Eumeta variegata TaxID=151549 RepID=A0A4C1WC10_EUMVA|nr:hypothetical protein EVAR_40063_1 [Eumeta japonica]
MLHKEYIIYNVHQNLNNEEAPGHIDVNVKRTKEYTNHQYHIPTNRIVYYKILPAYTAKTYPNQSARAAGTTKSYTTQQRVECEISEKGPAGRRPDDAEKKKRNFYNRPQNDDAVKRSEELNQRILFFFSCFSAWASLGSKRR